MNGTELLGFYAYHPNFGGGVPVAVGDVNGDGRVDIITGAGAGGGPHVRVFSGMNQAELFGFYAFDPNFSGGVFLASGDVNGDGRADVYAGAGPGAGPHVRVFSGLDQSELHSFYAYHPLFGGGVRLAAGDLDGDGRDDIITAAGPGGGPHVRGLSGLDRRDLTGFFAYDAAFAGGVFVAGAPSGAPLGALRREGAAIASSAEHSVTADGDAAGRGWFVDPTPEADEEFALVERGRAAAAAAIGSVDLLTVVLHEWGHVLGLGHEDAGESAGDLMFGELSLGARRLPTIRHLDDLLAQW
jgi:hypothetical protein